jgi:hypothetical protein
MCLRPWFTRLFCTVVVLELIACKSVVEKIKPSATPIIADGQPLTFKGENIEPTFSPDGLKILYVSIERPTHHAGQVYELDLKTQRERRITFQGTAAHSPQYNHRGDAILYSSATDELKENPPLLQTKKNAEGFIGPSAYVEPTELYLHHLQDLSMSRITRHVGFDGEAKFISPTEIIFTRRTDQGLGLMQTSVRGRSTTSYRGAGARAAQFAPGPESSTAAWIEYSEDFKSSNLKVRDGHTITALAESVPALKQNPVWTPDGQWIVFSMNHPTPTKSEIFVIRKDGHCLQALTQEGVWAQEPAVSPTGDAFLFVSNQSGSRQIYLKPFPKNLTCEETPTSQ